MKGSGDRREISLGYTPLSTVKKRTLVDHLSILRGRVEVVRLGQHLHTTQWRQKERHSYTSESKLKNSKFYETGTIPIYCMVEEERQGDKEESKGHAEENEGPRW